RITPPEASRFDDSLFGLAPDEVFRAASLAPSAVVSYTTLSPLPRLRGAVCFSVALSVKTYLRVARVYLQRGTRIGKHGSFRISVPGSALELRGIVLCGVRTFLLRLASKAILRSSKIDWNVAFPGSNARQQDT